MKPADVEEHQRQSEERQRILTAMGDGVFGLDKSRRCGFMNPASLQILGYTADEVIGSDVHELFHGLKQDGTKRTKSECAIIKSLYDGKTRHQEDWFIRKDGSGLPVHMTVAPVMSKGQQEGVVVVFSDNSERLRLEHELRTQASTDALTGLPNRRHFLGELESELSRIKRNPEITSAVLMLDLDNFKEINDRFGHSSGDEVLKHFAKELTLISRKSDKLGRLGGEEFCLLLPSSNVSQATQMAERLCSRVAGSPVITEGNEISYTVSIGVAMMQSIDRSVDVALVRADQALYHGRDTATLDGIDLVTPEMVPPPPDPASTIAIFILDADGDGQTDGGPVPGPLAEFPFLQQYDAFLDAGARQAVTLTLNDVTLHVPTWKADSEGVIIAVFDQGEP